MSCQLKDLELRQRELKTQSTFERKEFGKYLETLKKPFSRVDKGLEAFLFLKSNPLIWTSALTVLVYYKPKLASKLLIAGTSVIKLLKNVQKLI